jgi:arsenate reductase-like glutaredoxin family protein
MTNSSFPCPQISGQTNQLCRNTNCGFYRNTNGKFMNCGILLTFSMIDEQSIVNKNIEHWMSKTEDQLVSKFSIIEDKFLSLKKDQS